MSDAPEMQHGNDPLVRELMIESVLSIRFREFIRSELGEHLISRADAEIKSCKDQLAVTEPADADAIRALQQRIRVATIWQDWMADAITTGDNAVNQLQEMGL